jgi:hypothetical protein
LRKPLYCSGFLPCWTPIASIFLLPIFGWRRVKNALINGSELPWLRWAFLGFGLFEFVMVLKDSRTAAPFSSTEQFVFQIAGGLVLIFGCFKLFVLLRARGFISTKDEISD